MKTNRLVLSFILVTVLFLQTCKEVEKQMLVETGVVSNVKISSADVSGKILDLGEGVSAYGHCYSTDANDVTTASSKTSIGNEPKLGGYISTLTGLLPNQTYYVKAYCSRGSETVYGERINFKTASADIPVLSTRTISDITKNAASSGGLINSQGGTPITAKGVCWSQVQGPTVNDFHSSNGEGSDNYFSTLSGLAAGTKYYVRAYAVNEGGTAYGNQLDFTTTPDAPVLPTATTSSANPVNITSATLNGVVNANGQSTTVTFEYGLTNSYGIAVAASQSPVTGSVNTDVGVEVTGLIGGTLYHFRVKAENGGGVTYGLDQTFTTLCAAPSAATSPASNLTNTSATLKGAVNANNFATTVIFEYGLTAGYGSTLPDKEGIITGTVSTNVSADLSGLQPNTTYHYRITASSCGGTVNGSDQIFVTYCTAPSAVTTAATNAGITTATLNGNVNANNFSSGASFEYGTTTSYSISVPASPGTVNGTGNTPVAADLTGLVSNTLYHFRVNAVNCGGTVNGNDLTLTTMPIVTITRYLSDLNIIACEAVIDAGGGAPISERGFCWSTNQNPTVNDNKTTNGTGTGIYSGNIMGLMVNTAYYVRAYAKNSSGTAYSGQYVIKTSAGTVVDADGNLYASVTIGTQVWMRENLRTTKYNDGTSISLVSDNTTWSSLTTAAYCWYNNDEAGNKVDYGALYNRHVNTAKLCPAGWHVPTLNNWITLENYLGGLSIAGGKLKEIGTWHWTAPNTGATNESGFTAFPGGYRNSAGQFLNMGTYATFWTSDNYSSTYGWHVYLNTNNAGVTHGDLSFKAGASVRCVKD